MPVYLVVFLGYIGYSLFLTIFAPALLQHNYIEHEHSTRMLLLGVIIFMYPFGQFVSSPVLGALSDRFGRKPLLIYSLAITTLVYILIGICLINKWIWIMMGALFVAGLSEGNVTIAQSAVADISTKRTRHRMFGYIYFAGSCSYVIGPILGGWLATRNLTHHGHSYYLPFFFVALLLLICLMWVALSFRETAEKQSNVSYIDGLTNIKNLFTQRKLRFWFLVNFILYLAAFGFLQGFPIYVIAHYGISVRKLSMMIAWTDIPFLVVNLFLIDYLSKKIHTIRLLLISSLVLGVAMVLMIVPNHEDWLWPLLFINGLSAAIILTESTALISLIGGEHEQGRALGVNQSLNFLTEAVSGLVVGLLSAAYLKLTILMLGCMGFVAALLLLLRRKSMPTI